MAKRGQPPTAAPTHAKKARPAAAPSTASAPPATAAEAAAAATAAAAEATTAEALPVPPYVDGLPDAAFKNRERVLLLSSRGITSR